MIEVDNEELKERIESCLQGIPANLGAEKDIIRILLQALCPELAIVITMAAKQSGSSQVFWQGATAVPRRRRTENASGDIASQL